METIIQQIAMELVKNILKDVQRTNLNPNELSGRLLASCKEAVCKITEACAQEVNQQMRCDKAWRKGRLIVKEKNRVRRILSAIGELRFEWDYYYDPENKRYAAPLDEMLGIAPYERLLPSIGAEKAYALEKLERIYILGMVGAGSRTAWKSTLKQCTSWTVFILRET